jgi:ketosteroid isomerase-like protein
MSDESRNVEILREAYRRWSDSKGASADEWMKICADNIAFGSLAQGAAAGANYLTAYPSRDALKDYFAGLTRDWQMIEFVMEQFVAQGDRVVALGSCTWRYKKTGKVVSTPKADAWRMKNGKAVEFFEYYDTAQVHAAVAAA